MRYSLELKIATLVISAGTLLWSADAGAFMDKLLKTKTTQSNAEMDLGEYKGLKHAIGSKDFENQSGWHGQWKLGYNLSIMLESALYDTGRFVIVEREKLGDVLGEQDLAASGRAAKAKKVAQTGKVRLAKYIATGAVTEVEESQAGGSGGINTPFGRISANKGQAHITVIVKLIDTTTSEVVAKERIVGKAGKGGLRLSGVTVPGTSSTVDLGGFKKTPLGEAAQDCIVKAAEFIAKAMEEQPFEGAVVQVSKKGQVIINRGSQFGVEVGQVLSVEEEGEALIDPDTGEVLDEAEGEVIGRIKVARVKEKISYCDIIDGGKPDRGAVVRAAVD